MLLLTSFYLYIISSIPGMKIKFLVFTARGSAAGNYQLTDLIDQCNGKYNKTHYITSCILISGLFTAGLKGEFCKVLGYEARRHGIWTG